MNLVKTNIKYNIKIYTSVNKTNGIFVKTEISDPGGNADFIALNYESPEDEEIYGLGL